MTDPRAYNQTIYHNIYPLVSFPPVDEALVICLVSDKWLDETYFTDKYSRVVKWFVSQGQSMRLESLATIRGSNYAYVFFSMLLVEE